MTPSRSLQPSCARTGAILHDLLVHEPQVFACAEPLVDRPAQKPVLQESEPGPASPRRRLGTPKFILEPGQVSLDHDPVDEPGNSHWANSVQIHRGIQARRLLPPCVVAVGTATFLWRAGAGAADACRMPIGRPRGHASSTLGSCSRQHLMS